MNLWPIGYNNEAGRAEIVIRHGLLYPVLHFFPDRESLLARQ
jgi:hypothetical protein